MGSKYESFSLAPQLNETPATVEEEILNLTNPIPCSSHFNLHTLCQRMPVAASMHGDADTVALERVMGIEPTFKAWEALVLPLNYTRI